MPKEVANLRLYDVEELARKTGIHRNTVLRYIREGKLHARRFGAGYRIPETSIRAFFDLKNGGIRRQSINN